MDTSLYFDSLSTKTIILRTNLSYFGQLSLKWDFLRTITPINPAIPPFGITYTS